MGEKKLLFDTISQKFQNSELSVTAPLLITISFDTRAIMTKTTTPKKKSLHDYFNIWGITEHHNMLDSTRLL